MYDLPLFPLNVVLFPGTPLRLHIFEERYKEMIRSCMDQQRPFGVVLIKKGQEALGPLAEPHLIGTTATIIKVHMLPDGRMNIIVGGSERFRIRTINPDRYPYLVGNIEIFQLAKSDSAHLPSAGQRLSTWVRRYIDVLTDSGNFQFDIEQLPVDPVQLAYMSASLLQLPNEQKQSILSLDTADELLDIMVETLRSEIALLKALGMRTATTQGAFSNN